MVTFDDVIRWVDGEFVDVVSSGSIRPGDLRAYECVMTILSTLDYAKLLTDKFGSLEEAMEAEKVVHCRDCGIWNSEKEICNKPCESMKWRRPNDYCSDGRLYERKFVERVADAFSKVGTVNPISPAELRAALERSKNSNETLESV